MREFLEAAGGEPQALPPDHLAARIGDHRLERQALDGPGPVGGAHDDAELHLVAGPVDAAVGEHVGGQLARLGRIRDAADVEARQVEQAIAATHRQEGRILVLAHQVQRRLAIALRIAE